MSAAAPVAVFFGARRRFLLLAVLAGLAAGWWLGLDPSGLRSGPGSLALVGRFFGAALSPALTYESAGLPPGTPPLWRQLGGAMVTTVQVAAAAVSLSVVAGLVLGFLGSAAWWPERGRARQAARAVWGLARTAAALFRSVHELIWATLFLAAVGLTPLTAVLAIAIPYTGTLAKVFGEMCEEAPPETRAAWRTLGATPLQFYFLGLVPRVLADLLSYVLYRFECGLRSAAVLGFLGIPTLGYFIKLSFENTHYREVWTYLFALLALVMCFDHWSGAIRQRLASGPPVRHVGEHSAEGLHRTRPRDHWVRASGWALAVITAGAWLSGDFAPGAEEAARRGANLRRFLTEIQPWPVREGEAVWSGTAAWAGKLWHAGGAQAAATTFALSLVSIVLAGGASLLAAPWAARTLARPRPYDPELGGGDSLAARWIWRLVSGAMRLGLIFARAVPEYIWGFLFLAMFAGPEWAAALALALHNTGILGRLGAEVLENAPPATPLALRAAGATRATLYGFGLLPLSLPRWLVFFFYRWETCLREGTVLGLLGLGTLGRLVTEARARDRYDEMLFFVLLGAALVLVGDGLSALVRRRLRA